MRGSQPHPQEVGTTISTIPALAVVFIVAALRPAIPATSGAAFAPVLLGAVAISAYLVTYVALLRIARRGPGMRAGTRVA